VERLRATYQLSSYAHRDALEGARERGMGHRMCGALFRRATASHPN
jgi:hypothetical protein